MYAHSASGWSLGWRGGLLAAHRDLQPAAGVPLLGQPGVCPRELRYYFRVAVLADERRGPGGGRRDDRALDALGVCTDARRVDLVAAPGGGVGRAGQRDGACHRTRDHGGTDNTGRELAGHDDFSLSCGETSYLQ